MGLGTLARAVAFFDNEIDVQCFLGCLKHACEGFLNKQTFNASLKMLSIGSKTLLGVCEYVLVYFLVTVELCFKCVRYYVCVLTVCISLSVFAHL